MIVLPLRRSVGLRAVTASLRVFKPTFATAIPSRRRRRWRFGTGWGHRSAGRVEQASRSSLLEVLGDRSVFARSQCRDDDVLGGVAVLTLSVGRILLDDPPTMGTDITAELLCHTAPPIVTPRRGSHRTGRPSTTIGNRPAHVQHARPDARRAVPASEFGAPSGRARS